MSEETAPKDARIDAALREIVELVEPGATLLSEAPLSGGMSYKLRILSVGLASGVEVKLVLREAANLRAGRWGLVLAHEFHLIEQLHAAGVKTSKPRLFDDSGTILRHPFAVYDYAEGAPLFQSDDPVSVGLTFATELVSIHELAVADFDLAALPDWATFAGGVVAETPRTLDSDVQESLIRKTLSKHWPPPAPAQRSLLHGDFWPGNVIWRDNSITTVLDWENAAIGDPAADVAITRLDLLWSFGISAATAFTSKYRSLTGNPLSALAIWDLFSALRPAGDLANWAAEYPKLGRPDITFATMKAGHRWFLSQALAALG